MEFDAYFFDFDGTLGATEPDIRAAWLAAIRQLGLPEEEFAARFRVGPPISETSRMLFPDLPPRRRELLLTTYKSFYDDSDRYRAVPYPGVKDMLKRVCDAGKKCYVVTNKRVKPLKKLMDLFAFTPLCHGIYPPDLLDRVNHLKKDALLALALSVSGVAPERALMVGDTELDVGCGKACGTKTCGVTWGYGEMRLLKNSAPDFLISDPADLP